MGAPGIRVNCVAPGVLATAAAQQMTEQLDSGDLLRRCLVARTPVGRLGDFQEIAAAIAFVAAGEADFLTGWALIIDGGLPTAAIPVGA